LGFDEFFETEEAAAPGAKTPATRQELLALYKLFCRTSAVPPVKSTGTIRMSCLLHKILFYQHFLNLLRRTKTA
jgi:hypothetical protein